MPSSEQDLGKLNAAMVAFCTGFEGKGLQQYYSSRTEKKEILSESDRHLVLFVAEHYPHATRVLELACGLAQASHALNYCFGFDNIVGAEIDGSRRFAGMELGYAINSEALICSLDWFNAIRNSCFDLVVTNNAVSSHLNWSQFSDALTQLATRSEYAPNLIICPSLFGEQNDERDPEIPGFRCTSIGHGLHHYKPGERTWPMIPE